MNVVLYTRREWRSQMLVDSGVQPGDAFGRVMADEDAAPELDWDREQHTELEWQRLGERRPTQKQHEREQRRRPCRKS